MKLSRRAALALASALVTSATIATVPALAQDKPTVGIAMPTKSSSRWISDGNSMVEQFKAAGYDTDLQYAEDDIPNQLAQIENMITKGVDVLVIAAIDGTTLSNALENAQAAGIKVIAYDRLIRESGAVDYYATFDNFKVGVLQANSLVQCLKERFPDQKPFNIELFGGSPDDNNAFFFYNGAMSVLQPMIDAGEIAVPSGQMGMDVVGTLRWDGAVAQSRMDNLLSANYGDKVLNGALSPYDGLSIGILSSVKGVGYGSGDLKMPCVTGQDAEVPSVKSMMAGEQYSTVQKAIAPSLSYVTEDRKVLGLILEEPILRNISLANLAGVALRGMLDKRREAQVAEDHRKALAIRTPGVLQKVVRAATSRRWCCRNGCSPIRRC